MKTLKQICDAVMFRIGMGRFDSYFGSNDETMSYLANESLNHILRAHNWQELRKTATISMTTATEYDLPSDIKYYVSDTMNSVDNERYIQFPAPKNVWWYFKTHEPSGLNYKVRQTGDKIEILNPDNGIDIKYEYISSYPVRSDGASVGDKEEFTKDSDSWLLDDELLILDLKWRYKMAKGLQGWQGDKLVFDEYKRTLIGQVDGSTTVDFSGGSTIDNPEPYTDLYVNNS